MLVYVHLLCNVNHLLCDIFVILDHVLILVVQLKAFVFKIVSLLDHSLHFLCDRVVNEFVFNVLSELVKKLCQLINFYFVSLDKLFLMFENRLLKSMVHGRCNLRDFLNQRGNLRR